MNQSPSVGLESIHPQRAQCRSPPTHPYTPCDSGRDELANRMCNPLPVPLLAPLLWAPALEGADTAGHWLPPLRNHGSGGSVPALGGGSGIFASGVSGSQARLMLLAFFGDQLLEEGDGGLRRKKKSLPKGRYQRVLETRRLLQRGCEGVGGCGGAMPYLCLSLSHRCHCPVACVSSLLSP